MILRYLIFSCLILLLGFSELQAQSLRSLNNNGVEKYKDKKFADAEVNFKKGLDKAPDNFITNFNLGDAYYQQKRYDEALKSYNAALSQAKTKNEKAHVYHNIGNSLLKSSKLKESIEAYKNSLKLNPNDEETKYNLSYALNMLKNQQKQNQNKNQQNKDQNKNQKQNKDQNKDQKNKDQQNKQDRQNQNKQKNQTAQQDATKQKQQNKISKQEAERILQALKNNEKKLQKKLRKQKGKPIKTDKDW
jgi:Ca-activated chloride channel homolog